MLQPEWAIPWSSFPGQPWCLQVPGKPLVGRGIQWILLVAGENTNSSLVFGAFLSLVTGACQS